MLIIEKTETGPADFSLIYAENWLKNGKLDLMPNFASKACLDQKVYVSIPNGLKSLRTQINAKYGISQYQSSLYSVGIGGKTWVRQRERS